MSLRVSGLAGRRVGELMSLLLVGCLTLGIFYVTACRSTDGQGGVPLDDAWIHFQFARNLARGDGLSFNPGEPTAGSTAPLWTLLLAAVYRMGGSFPVAGQVLSGVCFLLALAATRALSQQLTGKRWAAWLAGIIVAVNGRFVWAGLSALETCLFAALSLVAIGSHLKDRASGRYRLRTAALFALAALSRPEGYLLFALSLSDFVLRAPRTLRGLRRLCLPALLFAAFVLPYPVFSLRTSGYLLPNTFHAKATFDFRPDLDFLSLWARYLILDNPLLLPFFVLGVGVLLRRATLVSLWSVGLPLVYAFLHTVLYQHGRYLMPLIPCHALVGVVGLLEARKLARRRGWRWASLQTSLSIAVLSLLLVAGTAWRLPTMARQYARNVDEINRVHVALGHWVREHTPPSALLALNDIGAITYASQRPVVDLAGLVTPEVVPLLRSPDRASRLIEFMARRGVDYVVIFPAWFPDLAESDELEEVYRVTVEERTIIGGETMVVYRTGW